MGRTAGTRVAQLDQSALARLYDLFSPVVFGLTLKIVGDRPAAEEVTLDVYTQIWNTAGQYEAVRGSASSWLLLIARSRAIDYLRSRRRREQDRQQPLDETVAQYADTRPNPEQSSLAAGRHRIIRAALESLDPKQRKVIDLAFFCGWSHSEIASGLGQPLGTVKTRIRLGMSRLQELPQPYSGRYDCKTRAI